MIYILDKKNLFKAALYIEFMPLLLNATYEPKMRSVEEISPESILAMIKDVRDEIARLEPSFRDDNLTMVWEIIESGQHIVKGDTPTKINLRAAAGFVSEYRKHSEGGCQSCVNLGRETIDTQDATSGWYCRVSDPDYDKNGVGDGPRVRYSGFSPKVRKHYQNPCSDYVPRFSPPLKELIDKEQECVTV